MKKIILVCCAALALFGCSKEAVSSSATNNAEFKVELLFEHEGVKMYRFTDRGYSLYYTDARGKVEYNTGGKSSNRFSIETVD